MKKGLGIALAGIGAFLLVLAALLRFYAVPALSQAPLAPGSSTGGISTSVNKGVAAKLFYPGKLAEGGNPVRENVPMTATRTTRGDVQASQQQDAKSQNLAIYDSFQRLEDDEGTVVDAGTIRVAFNRSTSILANCCGANIDGEPATFEGINPLKFPFNVEQKTYDYYDTTIKRALPAEYQGQEAIQGLNTYKFLQTIPPTQIGEQEVPGSLVGSPDASYKAARFYQNVVTLWVDPVTGSVIRGTNQQKQYLTGPSGTEALTIIDLNIGTSDESITSAVDEAKKAGSLLNLLKNVIPLIGAILGIVLIALGFWLATRPPKAAPAAPAVPAMSMSK